MAIRVKHGEGDISSLVQLALLAGQGQQQLPQAPQLRVGAPARGSPGGSGGGIRHDRTPIGPRLGPVTRVTKTPEEVAQFEATKARLKAEATAPIEREMMEEEQRLQDEGWERRYSAKQRADITKINESMQRVRTMIASGEIDSFTGQVMLAKLRDQQNGIQESLFPPDPNKPPEERMPGFTKKDKQGNIWVNNEKGIPQMEQTWDKTPEGMERIQRDRMELEGLKQQGAQAKYRQDLIKEFMTKPHQPTQPGEVRTRFGIDLLAKDKPAGIAGPERTMTYPEAARKADEIMNVSPQQEQVESAAIQAAPQAIGAFDQVFEGMKESLTFTKAEQGLPDRVAMAQSFLREVKRRDLTKRGSSSMLAAIQEALQIGAEYDAALRSQER